MPGGPAYSIDSNGEIMLGQMYVPYVRLAAADVARRRHDRGIGKLHLRLPRLEMSFLRSGFDTYVSDAVERSHG